MISTPTGSWTRSRWRPHQLQLPVGVEIISEFFKIFMQTGTELSTLSKGQSIAGPNAGQESWSRPDGTRAPSSVGPWATSNIGNMGAKWCQEAKFTHAANCPFIRGRAESICRPGWGRFVMGRRGWGLGLPNWAFLVSVAGGDSNSAGRPGRQISVTNKPYALHVILIPTPFAQCRCSSYAHARLKLRWVTNWTFCPLSRSILCPIESVDTLVTFVMQLLQTSRWFRRRRAVGFDRPDRASGAIESNCPSSSKSSRNLQKLHDKGDEGVRPHSQ